MGNYLDKTGVATLWAKIKSHVSNSIGALKTVYAPIVHTHSVDDVTDLSDNLSTINSRIDNIEQSADEVLPFYAFVNVDESKVKNMSTAGNMVGRVVFNNSTQRFIYEVYQKDGTLLAIPEYYGGFVGVEVYNDGGASGSPFPDKLYLYNNMTYVFEKSALVGTGKPYVVRIIQRINVKESYTKATNKWDPGVNINIVWGDNYGDIVFDDTTSDFFYLLDDNYFENFNGKELLFQDGRIRKDIIFMDKEDGNIYRFSGGEMYPLSIDDTFIHETMMFRCNTAAATVAKKAENVLIGKDGDDDLRKEFHVTAGYVASVISSYTNTAKNPTLEIGDSGACPIYYAGAQITTSNLDKAGYKDYIQQYVYYGGKWYWIGWSKDENTTYSTMTATQLSTGTETTGKLVTAKIVHDFVTASVAEKFDSIPTVYTPLGSTTSANLKNLALTAKDASTGNYTTPTGGVYNITDELTTDSNFVEGAGKKYPAGTNVVLVETSDGTRKWDVLAGFVDMSNYMGKDDLSAITEAELDEILK